MQRFLIRRFLMTILSVLIVSVIIFAMARMAGDPRSLMMGPLSTADQWDLLGKKLGLDKPYYQQYLIFMKDLVQGDFGNSIFEHRPAREIIGEKLRATVELGALGLLWSTLVGVPLGIIGAVRRDGIIDRFGKAIALVGQAAPSFWLGIMLMFLFAVKLEWLPPSGRQEPTAIILPAITLGWFFVAINMRLIRSGMLDVLDSEYVKLARAKGASERAVIWVHALKNAVIPALSFFGVAMGSLIAGSITIEVVFAWPGLGRQAVTSMLASDYPVLQGIVIVLTLMYVGIALLVDILYAFIDPRIRYT